MKRAMLILIAVAMPAFVWAMDSNTPEKLAKQFIANVNARDIEGQCELLHPSCVKGLSGMGRKFMDASLKRDFRTKIPKKHNINVYKDQWEKSVLPFGKVADWPVKPTHRFDVEFSTGKSSATTISRFIVEEDDRWFITVPIINAEFLRNYADNKNELYVAGCYMREQHLGTLEDMTDYGKMLADELGIRHFNVRMVYDNPVYIAAHFSAKMEGETIKSRTVTLEKPSNTVGIYFIYRTKPLEPQTDKAYHWFNVMLTSFMKKEGVDKETEREYLQERPESEHIPGFRRSVNSYLFNSKRPLPMNRRVSYFTLIDEKGKGGKDVTYSIDFEVSESPVEGEESSS